MLFCVCERVCDISRSVILGALSVCYLLATLKHVPQLGLSAVLIALACLKAFHKVTLRCLHENECNKETYRDEWEHAQLQLSLVRCGRKGEGGDVKVEPAKLLCHSGTTMESFR